MDSARGLFIGTAAWIWITVFWWISLFGRYTHYDNKSIKHDQNTFNTLTFGLYQRLCQKSSNLTINSRSYSVLVVFDEFIIVITVFCRLYCNNCILQIIMTLKVLALTRTFLLWLLRLLVTAKASVPSQPTTVPLLPNGDWKEKDVTVILNQKNIWSAGGLQKKINSFTRFLAAIWQIKPCRTEQE